MSKVKISPEWVMGDDFSALADQLVPVVLAAGRVQMQHYRRGVAVATKADASPVTVADQQSEALILAALERIAPGVAVVAEESVAAGSLPDVGGVFFLVDPLDGTKEFVGNRGEFTVNIALVRDTAPVFGIVYAPALSDLYVTLSTTRAVRATVAPDAAVAILADLAVTDIAARVPDAAGLVVTASRSHMNDATTQFLKRYRVREVRSAGSSLKFCQIAAGEADLYPRIGPTSEWDIAAGHAILAAAGGSVTTLDGRRLIYGRVNERFRNLDYVAWGRSVVLPDV